VLVREYRRHKGAELRAPKPKRECYPKEINSLGDHIRGRRLDLNLLLKQVAGQIGVDATTIHNWESNASLPAIRYVPAILEFLGYDPFPPAQTLGERLVTARKALGLSQQKLALSLGVDPGTWQSWEAGQHRHMGRNVERVERFLETLGYPAVSPN
jgi:transcriptional regulator with XRE-family HTH domain